MNLGGGEYVYVKNIKTVETSGEDPKLQLPLHNGNLNIV